MLKYTDIQKVNAEISGIEVKGKSYAMVNSRIDAFRKICPNGSISTDIIALENGVVTMKATVCDEDGKVLGTGFAQEKETSSYINKTSFIENCVPLDTKILTKDGWTFYYQLNIGDDVMSYNMKTGRMEFCKLTAINIHKNRPLVMLKTSRFSVICTPQHKWLARTQYKPLTKMPTEELTRSWKIVQAVKQEIRPSDIGLKLGWLMCDCDMTTTPTGMASTAYINQSKYVDEVSSLFGEGRKCKSYDDKWMDNYEWIIPAAEVRRILGIFRMASYKDLPKAMASTDLEHVAGCFKSMMLADGEKNRFSSTYPELIDAMQIMCARLGIATTFVTSRMMENSTKPIYTLGIKSTDGAWFSEMKVTNLPPKDVWCPTTENGTWVMNQGGFVTLTSNCETSAVGRALGMCGIGVADSIASAEELVNAISNQSTKRKTTNKAENKPKEKVSAESGNSGWQRQKSAENGSEDDDIKKAKHEFVQRCNENGQSAVEIMEKAGWSIDKGDATLDDYAKANIILDERLGVRS